VRASHLTELHDEPRIGALTYDDAAPLRRFDSLRHVGQGRHLPRQPSSPAGNPFEGVRTANIHKPLKRATPDELFRRRPRQLGYHSSPSAGEQRELALF